MDFLKIAQDALEYTRNLLKPSLKSGNKRYGQGPIDRFFASEADVKKWDRRNANQEKTSEFFAKSGCVVSVKGLTILEASKLLHNRAQQDASTWYGNCGEQANVALYACHVNGKVPPENLYIITYETKSRLFAHSLVLLADPIGKQQKPVCCDPWLNIACKYDDYAQNADNQLKEWTRKGKRLSCGTTGWPFNSTKWVEPSNAEILGFAKGEPKYWVSTHTPTGNER